MFVFPGYKSFGYLLHCVADFSAEEVVSDRCIAFSFPQRLINKNNIGHTVFEFMLVFPELKHFNVKQLFISHFNSIYSLCKQLAVAT